MEKTGERPVCPSFQLHLWDVKYTIDAWGNLTQKTVQSGYGGEGLASGAANDANQLPGYTYDGGTASVGNVTYDGTNTYTYDSENRIVTAAGVTYTYDGDGERVQKSSGKTYWGGGNGAPLLETDNSGNAQNEYVYFNGTRIARRAISGGLVHYTFDDNLKSATVIADNTGAIQKQYDYAPYGELHWQSGTDPNHYQFSGKELDTETGDSYFGARYYRCNMGRFITPDWSATPEAVPYATLKLPQTLNLYAYVGNNPIVGIDPDGHNEDASSSPSTANSNDGPGHTPSEQNQAQQQQLNNLSNVVENETSSLKPDPNAKPGQPGSAEDLAAGQLAVAEVANRVINAGHPGQVAPSTLYDSEAAGLKRGDPAALDAHARSRIAAEKAIDGSNTTNGAKQYRTRIGSNVTTPLGKSKTNPGTPISMHFGPFVEGKHTVVIVVAP